MRPETRASSGGGGGGPGGGGKLRWGRGRRRGGGSHGWREEEGFSVGWNMCGSILHAAHVPLTATVCLFSALASIASYTLDRHQPPQPPPPPPGHLNGRRSHRRCPILLDIYFSTPLPSAPSFPFDGSSTSNDELVNRRRGRNPKTNRELGRRGNLDQPS